MQKEIEIICCSLCKPIERDELKYQTDIIATNCRWLEPTNNQHSLDEKPQAEKNYTVLLQQPVKFRTDMDIWLYYDNIKVSYEGYTTEQDVEQSAFCYGKIISLIEQTETGAIIRFDVQKTLGLQKIIATNSIKILPDFWADFYLKSIEMEDYHLQTFGKYYQLSASIAQGDIGQNCIFTKKNHQYIICKITEWNFHGEYRFGGSFILPETISSLLNIE